MTNMDYENSRGTQYGDLHHSGSKRYLVKKSKLTKMISIVREDHGESPYNDGATGEHDLSGSLASGQRHYDQENFKRSINRKAMLFNPIPQMPSNRKSKR